MTILTTEKAVCPIDGAEFEYTALLSYGTYGCALDGLPISLTHMPHAIPACPICRFPVWIQDLTDAELEMARAVVESPTHEAMTREASYLHLEYLLEALGRSEPVHRANNLLKACWQTSPRSDRYAGYARQLGEATDAASDDLLAQGKDNWVAFQTFVANVERQAGMWEAASARLDVICVEPVESDALARRITRTRALILSRDSQRSDDEDRRLSQWA